MFTIATSNTDYVKLIDCLVRIIWESLESFTLKGRVKQKLKLDKIWLNCGLTTTDKSVPKLKKYQEIGQGYYLEFELPIGLCPSDFTGKKEKLIYAIKKATDIDITDVNRRLIINVKTIDGKPLL